MGGLLRCEGCGSIRWDVLGLEQGKDPQCDTCGQPLKPERRHPGRRARSFDRSVERERRNLITPRT